MSPLLWLAACAPSSPPPVRHTSTVPTTSTAPTGETTPTLESCGGSKRTIDWSAGVLCSGPDDGWWVASRDTYNDDFDVAPYSVSLDATGEGLADLFFVTTTAWDFGGPWPVEGLYRIDNVKTAAPGAVDPSLLVPGAARVDAWEDTTGDGIPELVVAAQQRLTQTHAFVPLALDLYLVDPTQAGGGAPIGDVALAHLHVGHGTPGPVGDFDADGRPEVVYFDLDASALSFLGEWPTEGAPAAPDALISLPVASALQRLVAGDVNADGATDLGGGAGWVMYGGSDLPTRSFDESVALEPWGLWFADIDGDGADDAVTSGGEKQPPAHLRVHYGQAGGLDPTPDLEYTLSTVSPWPAAWAFGDLDGDRRADLVVFDPSPAPALDTWAEVRLAADDFAEPALVLTFADTWPPGGVDGSTDLPDVDLDGMADLPVRNLWAADRRGLDWLWGSPRP